MGFRSTGFMLNARRRQSDPAATILSFKVPDTKKVRKRLMINLTYYAITAVEDKGRRMR